MMTVGKKKGMALFLVFLLVFQIISRGEIARVSAVENSGQGISEYHFLVTESRVVVSPDEGIAVEGAKVQITLSERISSSEFAGKHVTAEDGSSILLEPGTKVGEGITDGQGKVTIQIPGAVPAAYCEYAITCEGYHSLESVSMEHIMPQAETEAMIDRIPVFGRTQGLKITWEEKNFTNVLTDGRGNALPDAKYSIKKLLDGENAEIAPSWIAQYVSVDENTGKVTPGNLAGLPEASVKLPLKLTVQGKKTGIVGHHEDIAEYELKIDRVEDALEWELTFAEDKLTYGAKNAVLKAVSPRKLPIKYKVVKGAEFISIDNMK